LADDHNSEDAATESLTIHELSERVGMTVRNLREWKTLGLLPAAEVRGRTGYYDPRVVDRIEGIKRLHGEGFPLDLIRRMLEASGGSGDEVMRFAHALRAPFRDADPPVVEPGEWSSRWGDGSAADLDRAVAIGLVRERADGRLEFASERVAEVGESLRALGLSLEEILDASARIRDRLDDIAELFEQVWLLHIWEPFVEDGMPEERLPELQGTLGRVQPLAMDAVAGLFAVAMEAKIEEGIAREIARASARRERP